MAKRSLPMFKGLLYHYLRSEGWLPAGTTAKDWQTVKVAALGFDSPPLTHAPNLQKERAGLDLQSLAWLLGATIPSPAPLLGQDITLGEVAKGMFESQMED